MNNGFGISAEEEISSLQLIFERKRISYDLLRANFGSPARVNNILTWLESKNFISKMEGSERWEIHYEKIKEYLGAKGVSVKESEENEQEEKLDKVCQPQEQNLNTATKSQISDDVLFIMFGAVPNIVVGFWLLCLVALDKSNSEFCDVLVGVGLLGIVVFLGAMFVKLGFEKFVEYIMLLILTGMFVYPAMFVIGGMILGSMGYL